MRINSAMTEIHVAWIVEVNVNIKIGIFYTKTDEWAKSQLNI